jgi:hypothetical protein
MSFRRVRCEFELGDRLGDRAQRVGHRVDSPSGRRAGTRLAGRAGGRSQTARGSEAGHRNRPLGRGRATVSAAGEPGHFRAELVAEFDEPVRRYLGHAIREGAPISPGTHLTMSGRIKVGLWLPFSAEQRCEARSFEWRARVGWGRIRPLEVLDGYADGRGRTSGRLLGRVTLFDRADDDTARSGAGRAALEAAVWAPASLLGDPDIEWRAESAKEIVTWAVPPERPEVRLQISSGRRDALARVMARADVAQCRPTGGVRRLRLRRRLAATLLRPEARHRDQRGASPTDRDEDVARLSCPGVTPAARGCPRR